MAIVAVFAFDVALIRLFFRTDHGLGGLVPCGIGLSAALFGLMTSQSRPSRRWFCAGFLVGACAGLPVTFALDWAYPTRVYDATVALRRAMPFTIPDVAPISDDEPNVFRISTEFLVLAEIVAGSQFLIVALAGGLLVLMIRRWLPTRSIDPPNLT
jgi:hypothetical protein